jgi:Fe-S-cluster-containing dehydrogenase component
MIKQPRCKICGRFIKSKDINHIVRFLCPIHKRHFRNQRDRTLRRIERLKYNGAVIVSKEQLKEYDKNAKHSNT